MAGTFDPAVFLNATITEALDTRIVPIPAGDFTAIAGDVKVEEWQGVKDPSKSGLKVNIMWQIDDPGVKQITGRDNPMVRQEIMLDLTENKTLATGKGMNVRLGQLREALGLNTPGQPFSFSMISGRPAKVKIKQRPHPDDPERILNDVAGVAKL